MHCTLARGNLQESVHRSQKPYVFRMRMDAHLERCDCRLAPPKRPGLYDAKSNHTVTQLLQRMRDSYDTLITQPYVRSHLSLSPSLSRGSSLCRAGYASR